VGLSATDGNNQTPNVLMSTVVGLATVLVLLKTQGMMMQFSYVSMGASNARKLGGQFMNGVSYMTGKGTTAVASVASKRSSAAVASSRRTNHASSAHTKTTSASKTTNTRTSSRTVSAPQTSAKELPKSVSRSESLKTPLKNTAKEKES
jgi:hypothetical protein